jgi:hypothetical protein
MKHGCPGGQRRGFFRAWHTCNVLRARVGMSRPRKGEEGPTQRDMNRGQGGAIDSSVP